MGFSGDFGWQEHHLEAVKRILGGVFFSVAPKEADQKFNTDLLVIQAGAQSIACRLRRGEYYLDKYPFDVTFRSSRPSGAETELSKMLRGFGDFMFYGFEVFGEIPRWVVLDLARVRAVVDFRSIPDCFAGDASFKAIDTREHDACVFAHSPNYWSTR